MKFLLKTVFFIVLTVVLVLIVRTDHSIVHIRIGTSGYTMALSLFVLINLTVVYLGYKAIMLLKGFWNLSGNIQKWNQHRRTALAAAGYQRAILAMSEGNWKLAERELIRHVKYSDMPLINYLYAARAAQHQDAVDRRDRYLELAHECSAKADVPIGITKAELHINQHQLEQALAVLTHLRPLDPRNNHILKLLLTLHKELHDWESLRKLLPVLRKRQVVNEDQAGELELQVYTELLKEYDESGDTAKLQQVWSEMPKALKDDAVLVSLYAGHLIKAGKSTEAEALLRGYLKHNWNEKIVYLYSQVDVDNINKQLATVEALAEEHGKNPLLLLTLGKLCVLNKLWGKARIYLESSIGAGATTEAYKELGSLLEKIGQRDEAMVCYQKGIGLAARQSREPVRSRG